MLGEGGEDCTLILLTVAGQSGVTLVSSRKGTCQAGELGYLDYSPTSQPPRQDLPRTLHEHAGHVGPSRWRNSTIPGPGHTPAGSVGRESLSDPSVSWGQTSAPTPRPPTPQGTG